MKKSVIAILITIGAIILLCGIYIGAVWFNVNSALKTEVILNNVYAAGINLGGKTVKEAASLLAEHSENTDSRIMTISLKDKEISFMLRNAGIEFDINKTANKAYELGREGSLFKKSRIINNLKNQKRIEIAPEYKENRESFRETVLTLFAEKNLEFNKFVYEISGDKAKIKINKEYEEINFEKLFKEAHESIKGDNLKLSAQCIKGKGVSAEEIYNKICIKTTDARADVKDGVTILIPETDGISANIEDINKNLYEGKEEFEIPIKREKANVTINSIQGDFFKDVLGTYTTYFNANVTGRSKNVALAASKINGTILNSGDVFSYNDTVGRASSANGFAMATVYTSEGTQQGVGGGICQVSSTLYNAVLYADLKIVNRKHHSYTVSYVKPGLDATVSYGSIDFKFKNDTNGPVKISAYTNNGALTVTIYGKKQNGNKIRLVSETLGYIPYNTVEKENLSLKPGEKNLIQAGSQGVKATVTKITTDASGRELKRESLGYNQYQPLNEIVEIGPPLKETELPEQPESPSAENPKDTTPPDVSIPSAN